MLHSWEEIFMPNLHWKKQKLSKFPQLFCQKRNNFFVRKKSLIEPKTD
jgi:hypothetical protein